MEWVLCLFQLPYGIVSLRRVPKRMMPCFRFVPEQIVGDQLFLFDLGAQVPKRIVKYSFHFSIWERKSKTNSEKWGVANAIGFGLAMTME